MTKQRDLKALIRERMAKTGEQFTAARAALLGAQHRPAVAGPIELKDCSVCGGVLSPRHPTSPLPAVRSDLVEQTERLASLLLQAGRHARIPGAVASEVEASFRAALLQVSATAHLLEYDLVHRGGFSLMDEKRERPWPLSDAVCSGCGRPVDQVVVPEELSEELADDFSQNATMLFSGIVRYVRTGDMPAASNMVDQALRQIQFSFEDLTATSRYSQDPLMRAVALRTTQE